MGAVYEAFLKLGALTRDTRAGAELDILARHMQSL
ncbi:MAG: hypothetical protein ACJAVM_002879 [Sulfitobacter sp.]|jgi:hypothetical protein